MTRQEFLDLLDRYLKGDATETEKKLFDQFFDDHQKEGDVFWPGWALTDKERVKIAICQSLNKSIEQEAEVHLPKKSMPALWKVAAAITLLVGITSLLYTWFLPVPESYITQSTEVGQTAIIRLSDSTLVRLNEGSSITYPRSFDDKVRKVALSGEAFFEVRRDTSRLFIVKTRGLKTTVLGTSFTVKSYKDAPTEVTVASGKVKVAKDQSDEQPFYLTRRQQALFNPETKEISVKQIEGPLYHGWMKRVLVLDKIKLSEALDRIEEHFDVTVYCEDEELLSQTIRTQYKNVAIETVLEDLQFILDFRYTHRNDSIFIFQ